jgi:hypothetical protein
MINSGGGVPQLLVLLVEEGSRDRIEILRWIIHLEKHNFIGLHVEIRLAKRRKADVLINWARHFFEASPYNDLGGLIRFGQGRLMVARVLKQVIDIQLLFFLKVSLRLLSGFFRWVEIRVAGGVGKFSK